MWYTRNTKKREEDVQKGKIEVPKVWNFEAFMLNAILTKRREKKRKRDKKKGRTIIRTFSRYSSVPFLKKNFIYHFFILYTIYL